MGAYQEDHQRDHGVIKWTYSRTDTQVDSTPSISGTTFFFVFFFI
jgi:hypothetical protein